MAINNPFSKHTERLNILKQLRPKAQVGVANNPSEESTDTKCTSCESLIALKDLEKNLYLCPDCGFHMKMPAYARLESLFDGDWEEMDAKLVGDNPLNFPGYAKKLDENTAKSGLLEAVVCATGKIGGQRCAVAVLDSRFMMGSMGVAVGEKITRCIEKATAEKLPLVIFSASGGARMQEGIFSLMQMAKTSSAIARHDEAGLLYISVFTNPTTGGVTASFASLGDIMISEPEALIGFAGPRVIEQTIRQKLPEGFQRAEYLLEHGFLDRIVNRRDLKDEISLLLKMHERRRV